MFASLVFILCVCVCHFTKQVIIMLMKTIRPGELTSSFSSHSLLSVSAHFSHAGVVICVFSAVGLLNSRLQQSVAVDCESVFAAAALAVAAAVSLGKLAGWWQQRRTEPACPLNLTSLETLQESLQRTSDTERSRTRAEGVGCSS